MKHNAVVAMPYFKSIIPSSINYRSHAASLGTCQYSSKHPCTPLGRLHEAPRTRRVHSPTGLVKITYPLLSFPKGRYYIDRETQWNASSPP